MNWNDIVRMVWKWAVGQLTTPAGGVGTTVELPGFPTETKPMKPETIWWPSPNFRETNGRKVSCIVIHATAGGLTGSLEELCDPKPTHPKDRVSAHYVIDTNGDIYHLVLDQHIAWHAGISEWKGKDSVNVFSVGIELVNPDDGQTPYPKEQVYICAKLCKYLKTEFGIEDDDIVGHADVAPGRKPDPRGFDWDAFREALAAA